MKAVRCGLCGRRTPRHGKGCPYGRIQPRPRGLLARIGAWYDRRTTVF